VPPERYAEYRRYGRELGFRATFAGPFVRSSFHAGELLHADELIDEPSAAADLASTPAIGEWIALEAR
jgi:lipoic acid synthetase